jgi:hypothetical protein
LIQGHRPQQRGKCPEVFSTRTAPRGVVDGGDLADEEIHYGVRAARGMSVLRLARLGARHCTTRDEWQARDH